MKKFILNPKWTKAQHEGFNRDLGENEGYCPCMLVKTPETKCMCEEFTKRLADSNFNGECHCGRFTTV